MLFNTCQVEFVSNNTIRPISILLAVLQNNFKIIGVPEDIYFMNFIPIDINFLQILIISIITLLVTSLVSFSTAVRSSKILPSQALKYE